MKYSCINELMHKQQHCFCVVLAWSVVQTVWSDFCNTPFGWTLAAEARMRDTNRSSRPGNHSRNAFEIWTGYTLSLYDWKLLSACLPLICFPLYILVIGIRYFVHTASGNDVLPCCWKLELWLSTWSALLRFTSDINEYRRNADRHKYKLIHLCRGQNLIKISIESCVKTANNSRQGDAGIQKYKGYTEFPSKFTRLAIWRDFVTGGARYRSLLSSALHLLHWDMWVFSRSRSERTAMDRHGHDSSAEKIDVSH